MDPKTGDEKPVTISVDDGIRPGTSLADLAKLKPVFKKDGSTTAGTYYMTFFVALNSNEDSFISQKVVFKCM